MQPESRAAILTPPRPVKTARPRRRLHRLGRLMRIQATAVAVAAMCSCTTNEPPPAPIATLDPAVRAAIENDVRRELRTQLRGEVKEELRRELRAEIAGELRRGGTDGTRDASTASAAGTAAAETPAAPNSAPRSDFVVAPGSAGEGPGTSIATIEGTVRLLELAVGTEVVEREPQDVRQRYEAVPDMLYCYCSVDSRDSNQSITHVWRRDGVLVSRVELELGKSPRWKTWSKQKAQRNWTGLWSCEVLGPDGQHLGITRFAIGE